MTQADLKSTIFLPQRFKCWVTEMYHQGGLEVELLTNLLLSGSHFTVHTDVNHHSGSESNNFMVTT